jgi:hypothetical protein
MGPHEPQAPAELVLEIIILPDREPGDGGFVKLVLNSGVSIALDLPPSLFRVLYSLLSARIRDRLIDPEVRGFRSSKAIARAYAQLASFDVIYPDATIQRYVRSIRRRTQAALEHAAEHCDIPLPELELIESERGLGYRIPPELEARIIDHNPPRSSTASSGTPSAVLSC